MKTAKLRNDGPILSEGREYQFVLWGFVLVTILAIIFAVVHFGVRQYASTQIDPDGGNLPIAPDYPRHLSDFSLIDQLGHAFNRKDLDSKFIVVDFIFTSCTVTCPYVNDQMERVQELTSGQADVRLISLTLDPDDDTVQVLKNYSSKYDTGRWSFLTGDRAMMHSFVSASFLPPDTKGQFSYMPGNFAHTQRIVLVDKSGSIDSYFDGMNQEAANAVVKRINELKALR